MKKIIVAGVFLLLAALILALFPRYEISGAGGEGGKITAARLDRWTGEVEFFLVGAAFDDFTSLTVHSIGQKEPSPPVADPSRPLSPTP
jgi:hypothetical protein